MERDAAHRLMHRLKLHAGRRDFCCAHRSRPGDLLTWNDGATPHYAQPIDASTGTHGPAGARPDAAGRGSEGEGGASCLSGCRGRWPDDPRPLP